MEIVWQTPANPPERQDYIFRNGETNHSILASVQPIPFRGCGKGLDFDHVSDYAQGGVSSDPTILSSLPMLVLPYLTPLHLPLLRTASSPDSGPPLLVSLISSFSLLVVQVKNRWAGKTVVDFFAHEFKGRPYDYYVRSSRECSCRHCCACCWASRMNWVHPISSVVLLQSLVLNPLEFLCCRLMRLNVGGYKLMERWFLSHTFLSPHRR